MSQRPTAVRHSLAWLGMSAVLAASCACGSASASSATHGGLDAHDRATAARLARHEADVAARTVTMASAALGTGTVTDSNTGHPCSSGKLLHIKVVGEWNIAHGFVSVPIPSTSASDESLETVVMEADPTTGFACLLSFVTRAEPSDPGATVLFRSWHR